MTAAGNASGMTIGIVSNRDDPDGLGRVTVTLPAYGNRETDWVRIAVPYGGAAGDGHGVQWIPEKGDEVLLAFVHGDPKVPIVVGCLYSTKQKPPSKKIDERVFKSKKGHSIVISDEGGSERIEVKTKSGQTVTIDEASKTVTLQATQKVVVNAPAVALGGDPAMEPAILGRRFLTLFNNHTHPVAPGATGIVTPPIPENAVLSTITTLKG